MALLGTTVDAYRYYNYYSRKSYSIDYAYTDFAEDEANPDFVDWQNERTYQSYSSGGDDEYEGLVPEPAKLYFSDKRQRRFERFGYPATYDLRDHNKVSEIRDQGPNGSCWTFACYGSLESTLRPNEELDFSEKHMRNTHGFDWGPEKGGNRFISTAYLARWSGPIAEEDDPYSPYDFISPKGLERVKDIKEVQYLPDTDEDFDLAVDAIKDKIMSDGAVQTAMYASDLYLNKATWAHYCPRRLNGNHAITIVGWDDNYSKRNFKTAPPKDGAWLIRNSWGKDMGIDGYYWISYYDTVTGTNNAIYYAKDKGDSDKIYQYDPYGMTRTVGYNGKGYAANIFGPVKEKEYINGAGFYVPAANTDYKVYVVKNYKSNESLAKDRIEVASGSVEYPGYYTVTFDDNEVKAGDKFAVVVYFTSLETYYPIAIEARERKYASRVTAYPGQSYTSKDGTEWSDLTRYDSSANVCVKAFTSLDGSDVTPDKKVEAVKLNVNEITLDTGKDYQLEYTVEPKDAANKEVKFTSSDASVASVDSKGKVKALKEGTATITVTTVDGNFKDTCLVKVTQAVETIKVSSVRLDKRYLTMNAGETYKVNASVYPANATNKTIEYSSSDERVATVDSEGNITAKKQGYVYIYAKTADGPSAYVYVTVRAVYKPAIVKVTNVSLDKRYLTMNEGESTAVVASVYPQNATDKTINYSSSNESVATVDKNGNITAVKEGYAYIYAKSVDGPSAYVYVTVKAAAKPAEDVKITHISFDTRYLQLKAGEEYELKAKVTPENASTKSLTYYSSNERVATVDQTGKVAALDQGSAYIGVRSDNGVEAYVYLDVKGSIKPAYVKVEKLDFAKKEISLYLSSYAYLEPIFTPYDATNKNLTYSSLNNSIASVDQNGKVTPHRAGTVYIYARSEDGVQGYVKVTVLSNYRYRYWGW